MSKNRTGSELSVHLQSSEPLRKAKDPLPWLISTLRQRQEKLVEGRQRNEPHQETNGTS
jgi:hypothetical protein